jgi:hypothetical protein
VNFAFADRKRSCTALRAFALHYQLVAFKEVDERFWQLFFGPVEHGTPVDSADASDMIGSHWLSWERSVF